MASLSQAAGSVVWFFLVCCKWVKATFYDPWAVWSLESVLLGTEESLKSVVREAFAIFTRGLNGFSAWIYSIFVDKSYYKALRTNLTRAHAWQSWWANECYSTFNAIIERDKPGRTEEQPTEGFTDGTQRLQSKSSSNWSSFLPNFHSFPWASSGRGIKRTGSDLFENPAGWAVQENNKRRGFLEDSQLLVEIVVTKIFDFVRWLLGMLLFVPNPSQRRISTTWRSRANARSKEHTVGSATSTTPPFSTRLKRSKSYTSKSSTGNWTTSDVILQSGYPVENHCIVTEDGYVITMERIPRHGARDVAFFIHGIMDTSLGWVSNGVTGSQAFAAYDQGLDVWLGSSRANPPRRNIDPDKQGARYWHYTVNELGIMDVGAQIDFIHKVKCHELAAIRRPGAAQNDADAAAQQFSAPVATSSSSTLRPLARSVSDSALTEAAKMECATKWKEGVPLCEGSSSSSSSSDFADCVSPTYWEESCEMNGRSSISSVSLPTGFSPNDSATFPVPPAASSSNGGTVDGPDDAPQQSTSDTHHANGTSSSGRTACDAANSTPANEPYRLRAVAHSLGGAMLLMYTVTRRMKNQPHHVHRLILLTPAGYIKYYPLLALPFMWILPNLVRLLKAVRPGAGGPAIIIPTSLLRYVTFKLTVDLQHLPALNELIGAGIRLLLNGDKSEWDRAMRMPHYNTQGMPALSFHTGAHLVQWVKTQKFRLYDYGSPAENTANYGQPTPPDIGANYGLLDIPVDILAGTADGVISKENVRWHYDVMKAAGCDVTYKEFDFGHLDFTIAMKDDLRHYVLYRLLMRE